MIEEAPRAVVLADRAAVDGLRVALAHGRKLFEVRRGETGSEWTRVSGAEPFDWDVPLPLAGAKRFFFPAQEPLLRWHGETVEEVLPTPSPFVLCGVRPCDLAAIAYQDRFFSADPWYARRRGDALLVGLNCLVSCAGGFCRDVAAGPFASAEFDLNLTPLPDGRVVLQFGSDAGRAILDTAGLAAASFTASDQHVLAATAATAEASCPTRPFIARALRRINARPGASAEKVIIDAEWQTLGPACFACSGCTNLCPTCSCFTVVDQVHMGAGERVRYWDSCLFEGFQREASGHHPAPRPGDRVRRFWEHKFGDEFTERFGRPGCVGCGRCDVTCTGSIGALKVLAALAGPEGSNLVHPQIAPDLPFSKGASRGEDGQVNPERERRSVSPPSLAGKGARGLGFKFLPHRALIAEIIPESADTRTFVLQLEPPVPDFDAARPGQFVMLSILGHGEAAFTLSRLARAGAAPGTVVLTIHKVGALTGALFALPRGAAVGVRGPFGHGFPDDDPACPAVYVAGGCGLAPLKAAIDVHIAMRPVGTPLAIVSGTRDAEARILRSALASWQQASNVHLIECVERPDSDWGGRVGVVSDYVGEAIAVVGARRAAICGPPAMLLATAEALCRAGLGPEAIYVALERSMKCGMGECGHCYVNHHYLCTDGPVFSLAEVRRLPDAFAAIERTGSHASP
jgi:sulfhydrogenase subunit beta (sulfur reductase)